MGRSVQHAASRSVRDDRRYPRSFAELNTQPSPKLWVVHLLKGKPYRLAKKLLYSLLGYTLGSVMRYALAKLR